jgi:pimeloyl-ACP methyl ester carboxylesterase
VAGAAPGARLITVDGVQCVVAQAGDPNDPALLLIHGFGGSTFGYRDVMGALAARGWHVIAIDLPGFGLSEKSWERDYSHKAQATFALAALDQLNVDRAVLLGHSMGGNVISWILALAPERVAGLAYIDAAVAQPKSGVSSSPSTAEALLGVPPIRRLTRIVIRSAFTPATFGELLSSAFAVTSAVTPTLVTGYAASAQLRDWDLALLGIIRDSAKNSLPDSLANLTAAAGKPPTLILWGEADSWVPLRSGEVLRADLPAAEWVVLPGIGHVPFEEDVPTFIGVVGGWLDALR